ncbi:hypothetical protein ES708_20002 [subsurface metagenome]
MATSSPRAFNTAHEKSSLSFTFTDNEVLCSIVPMFSAMDINRLANNSSSTSCVWSSAGFFSRDSILKGAILVKIAVFNGSICIFHPSSTTAVLCSSRIRAKPLISAPMSSFFLMNTGMSSHWPLLYDRIKWEGAG